MVVAAEATVQGPRFGGTYDANGDFSRPRERRSGPAEELRGARDSGAVGGDLQLESEPWRGSRRTSARHRGYSSGWRSYASTMRCTRGWRTTSSLLKVLNAMPRT